MCSSALVAAPILGACIEKSEGFERADRGPAIVQVHFGRQCACGVVIDDDPRRALRVTVDGRARIAPDGVGTVPGHERAHVGAVGVVATGAQVSLQHVGADVPIS